MSSSGLDRPATDEHYLALAARLAAIFGTEVEDNWGDITRKDKEATYRERDGWELKTTAGQQPVRHLWKFMPLARRIKASLYLFEVDDAIMRVCLASRGAADWRVLVFDLADRAVWRHVMTDDQIGAAAGLQLAAVDTHHPGFPPQTVGDFRQDFARRLPLELGDKLWPFA